MNLQDLYKSVSQLGFEDSLGDDSTERFIYSANRALIEVDSLRPRRRSIDINHRVPENLLSVDSVIEKSETLTFTAKGAKSFYFEVAGNGEFTVGIKRLTNNGNNIVEALVIDNSSDYSTTFNSSNFVPIKGFIKYNEAFIDSLMAEYNVDGSSITYPGEVEITFSGDYAYTIRNFAMYDKVYSNKASDIINYSKKVGYSIPKIVTDFGRFDSPPVDNNGYGLFKDYTIENDTVYLPINAPGIYTVNYLHKVALISANTNISGQGSGILIDLEEDLAALLPNLIAAYVWLDDEPEKSQYYYNLYLKRADQIKKDAIDLNPVEFKSVYGW